MGTKNDPGKFDCYANAAPDEPLFVLLGRDKHAPVLVWLWAALRAMDDESPEKVAEARDCVGEMFKYQVANGRETCGVGQAALIGVLELIRAANFHAKTLTDQVEKDNRPTTIDEMRVFLSATNFGMAAVPADA